MVKNILWRPFCHHRTPSDGSLNLIGCSAKVEDVTRPNMVKKGGGIHVDDFLLVLSTLFIYTVCFISFFCCQCTFGTMQPDGQ